MNLVFPMVNGRDKGPSKSFSNLYVPVTPYYQRESGKRFLPFCHCGYHLGAIHPFAFVGVKSCLTNCLNAVFYEIPGHKSFDEDLLMKEIELKAKNKRNSPTVAIRPIIDPKTGGRIFWILDRGTRLYILRKEKVDLVDRIEEDHLKLDLRHPSIRGYVSYKEQYI